MSIKKKIYWRPSKLIEDPLTGEAWALMYGGDGRVRFVNTTDIQGPLWSEEDFIRRESIN